MESPLHSTSSQSSTTQSKPRTKAAMKGYENFKVSIPTTGIDLQQALNRSPNPAGCKLAALADIALGNDVPHAVGLIPSVCLDVEPSKTAYMEKSIDQQHSLFSAVELTPAEKPKIAAAQTSKKKITPIGNKLGFNQRKKKVSVKKPIKQISASKKVQPDSSRPQKPKDIYDFDDSRDSLDTPSIRPLISQTRSTKLVEDNKTPIDQQEESQVSSYSDRDDYNYDSLSDSDSSGMESHASSAITKRSVKSINNLQKKCLIMGRIFKSVKKTEIPSKETAQASTTDNGNKETTKKPIPKQELDKMFDSLRGESGEKCKNDDPVEEAAKIPAVPQPPERKSNGKKKLESATTSDKEDQSKERQTSRRSRKPREIANLEAEWGMSMDKIIDLMGVGQRKTQRRCAASKQKTFAETWSSDEYEEFHSTKDIIALIQEVERKASRNARNAKRNGDTNKTSDVAVSSTSENITNSIAKDESDMHVNASESVNELIQIKKTKGSTKIDKDKENKEILEVKVNDKKDTESVLLHDQPLTINDSEKLVKKNCAPNVVGEIVGNSKPKKTASFIGVQEQDNTESDIESDWSKRTSTKRSKIKKRRRTIAFKEDDSTTQKTNNKKQLEPTKQQKTNSGIVGTSQMTKTSSSNAPQSKSSAEPKPMARRKRIASEMLYYWSSSSDEEFGRIKPRENYNDDNLEQHGWIVGDSHKKLVTLLAHAKGKKIEDCGVKEAIHKKKS